MDTSVDSALEKIKTQEQDKEAQLKEKREYEASVAALDKATRDAQAQTERAAQECRELERRTARLRARLRLRRVQRDAAAQLAADCVTELSQLRAKADQGINEVFKLRSSLCDAVKAASNECDIWALLTKPSYSEPLPRPNRDQEEAEPKLESEARLREAVVRRNRLMLEKDRLRLEPDNGDDFIRKHLQLHKTRKNFSSKVEVNENEPIKFSTSPASRKTVSPIMRRNNLNNMPWYQPYSVLGSVTVFMIYFFILREENDMDQEFTKSLYDRIKGLEKEQLLQSYRFNKENGLSVSDIEKRLKELDEEEAKLVAE